MNFTETPLEGAYIIEIEQIEDERGFFARSFCRKEFEEHGLNQTIVQTNISYNKKKCTLRGMHYQAVPHEQAKLVSCIRGTLYDVIIDLRPKSRTFCKWFAVELTAKDYKILFIPKGFAHGFQTLEDDTVVFYQMLEVYHPESARGIRWDDPAFGIGWPLGKKIVSDRDTSWPDINLASFGMDSGISVVGEIMKDHYSRTFDEFGAVPRGVDWGSEGDMLLRYDKMLAIVRSARGDDSAEFSMLDVGCGYGGLYLYASAKGYNIKYEGIDVCKNLVEYAASKYPECKFYNEDILTFNTDKNYDYIVCNGILTQKLSNSYVVMDEFANTLINKMFSLCRVGIAFNVMTTKVNFMVDNLYYKEPVEMFGHCLKKITQKVRIDHAYPLYEYTMYLYKD